MQAYFCRACLLDTINSDLINYVRCPICYSYCSGTVEHYHTKAVLPMNAAKALYAGTELTDEIDEAIHNFDNPEHWRLTYKYAQQARERLITQPECYEAIKKCVN